MKYVTGLRSSLLAHQLPREKAVGYLRLQQRTERRNKMLRVT